MRRVLKRKTRIEFIKRTLAGTWTFVKTPMGFVTAIYGFLVVFWGAAIVLFLLDWIPTNSKNTQDIWVGTLPLLLLSFVIGNIRGLMFWAGVEISSQVVNGLFTVTGVGLIPWRSLDTYRGFEIYLWLEEYTDLTAGRRYGKDLAFTC